MVPLASGSDPDNGTFLGFGTAYPSYGSGLGAWNPRGTAEETRTFRITYALDHAASNSTQGGTASGAFVCETQTS